MDGQRRKIRAVIRAPHADRKSDGAFQSNNQVILFGKSFENHRFPGLLPLP
jgi:hypothetical protein